jgi:hypothetical protein
MLATVFRSAFTFQKLTPTLIYRFTAGEGEGEGGAQPTGTEITKENAQLIIGKWVKSNKVVLFMKGTPLAPLCGYSNFVVELLKKYGRCGWI